MKAHALFLSIAAAAAPVLFANASGPDAGASAAPGDLFGNNGCANASCHGGTPTREAGIDVTFGTAGSTTYTPGVKQTWTVKFSGTPAATVYGFQATARLASNERGQAGHFASTGNTTQVLCQDNRNISGTQTCPAATAVEYITHSNPSRTDSFTFDWTPPATDVGNIRVYVALNAANGNGANNGDRIFLRNFTLTPAAGQTSRVPQIRATQPVLQAFSDQAKVSAGTWIQIFGTDLASDTRSWAGGDFQGSRAPTSLDGTRVRVNGRDAFVSFISPTQVNAQAPDDDSTGEVTVEVITGGGTSNTARITKTKVSPALLTTPAFNVGGRQHAAALHPDFTTFVGPPGLIAGVPFRPAAPGGTIILFAVGCGPTNPASPAGTVLAAAAPLASPVRVLFGQTEAPTQAFLAANAVGLCQLNITVPNVADGTIALSATIDGVGTDQTLVTTVQR